MKIQMTQPTWAINVERLLDTQGRRKDWLAGRLGMHPSQLRHMLRGDTRYHLRPDLRRRIAEVLEVPEGMIFGEGDQDSSR